MTALARAFVLVVAGLSGEAEHATLFEQWGSSLTASAARLGVPTDRVEYLNNNPTRADVEQALARIGKASGPDDVVFIVLIGHGTFDGRVPKFNLKGPDLVPADLEVMLKSVRSRHLILVNTSSASGPFREALAGPGRTIVTATRNGTEQFATLFGGYFVDAFASETADLDKNRRVTVKEAFEFAQREVTKAYERTGLLATEHSVLDDTGKLASVFALGTADVEVPSENPAIRGLQAERRELEQQVESLKGLKENLDQVRYEAELERLVTALALKTRELRQAEAK
jgi:hypothetical protein